MTDDPAGSEGAWMVDYVVEAERLGATSVWLPEFWAHEPDWPRADPAGTMRGWRR